LTVHQIAEITAFILQSNDVPSEYATLFKGHLVSIAEEEPDLPLFYGIAKTELDLLVAEDISQYVDPALLADAIHAAIRKGNEEMNRRAS
jgi:hypothetical protein